MQEPFKFCSVCRAQNNLSAQFCQQCGAQYGWAPPQWAAPARPKQTGLFKLLITLFAVVFGCCAVSGIISVIRDAKTTPPKRVTLTNSPVPTSTPSPTPDLPPSELLARAKTLLARPYDKSAYDDAFNLLNRIPLAAKEYKESIPLKQKVTRAREREDAPRRREEAAAAKRREREAVAAESVARKLGADNVERGLLSRGYDATVTVSGPENRTIKITYVLMNRPTVYQLVEAGFLNQLRAQGFRKVIFSDGYGSTWWYNL